MKARGLAEREAGAIFERTDFHSARQTTNIGSHVEDAIND